MTGIFRTTVHSIVLGAGPQLTVLGILRTLQTSHHLITHHTGEIGVFTIGFLSSTPSWVTEDVYIWRPFTQTVELLILSRTTQHTFVILGTELG